MFKPDKTLSADINGWSFDFEFWPKEAEKLFNQGEFVKVIELCETNLQNHSGLVGAKIIYARALKSADRPDDASEQLYQLLSQDPNNIAALKLLGDIQFQKEDVVGAMASYGRVLEIDPDCRGLKCLFAPKEEVVPQKLILERGPEEIVSTNVDPIEKLFRTETVGDIYLKQGQLREALEIF
ncbi:MAG TPA: tetratricopeptide repeat protein, partial [candidate division Zixibacteria bacterium]|nr:tetratricopeptide repeat protein [candidate division Zixibacteria bacterium]